MLRLVAAIGVSAHPESFLELHDEIPVDRMLRSDYDSTDDPIRHSENAQRLTKQSLEALPDGHYVAIRYAYWCPHSQALMQKWKSINDSILKQKPNTRILWLETDTAKADKKPTGWLKIVKGQRGKAKLPNVQIMKISGGSITSYREKRMHKIGKRVCSGHVRKYKIKQIEKSNLRDPIIQTPATRITKGSLEHVQGFFIAVYYKTGCPGFKTLKETWNTFMEHVGDWPVYYVQSEEDKAKQDGGIEEFKNKIVNSTSVPNVQIVYKQGSVIRHTRIRYNSNPENVAESVNLFKLHWGLQSSLSCDTSGGFPANYATYYGTAANESDKDQHFPNFHWVRCKDNTYGALYCKDGRWHEVPKAEWKC